MASVVKLIMEKLLWLLSPVPQLAFRFVVPTAKGKKRIGICIKRRKLGPVVLLVLSGSKKAVNCESQKITILCCYMLAGKILGQGCNKVTSKNGCTCYSAQKIFVRIVQLMQLSAVFMGTCHSKMKFWSC